MVAIELRSHPLPPLYRAFLNPTLVTGASRAPWMSPQGSPGVCSPLPPGSCWRVSGFRRLSLSPLPPVGGLSLCWSYSCALGLGASWGEGRRPDWGPVGRTLQRGPGPAWPWLSAVTTVSPLWGPAAAWSTLCWARPSGSLTDRVSTRLSPEVWSPRGCPGLRQHSCRYIPGEHSRA